MPLNEPDREVVVTTVAFKSATINPCVAVPRSPRAYVRSYIYTGLVLRIRSHFIPYDENKIAKTSRRVERSRLKCLS